MQTSYRMKSWKWTSGMGCK